MAKVKGLALTNYIGRVGRVVYAMNKGQNIARELQTEVANPRTSVQMNQRTALANLVALYRLNQPWMFRGAFENKGKTLSDYNAFVQTNLSATEVALTKQEVNAGACVVAPVTITKGTLPSIQLQFERAENGKGLFVSDLYVGTSFDFTGATIADLSQALLDNNNGLQQGDQLSFIVNYQRSNGDIPYGIARYGELIIDTADERALTELDLPVLAKSSMSGRDDAMEIQISETAVSAVIILSREVSGKIKVSTQKFVLSTEAEAFIANYTSTDAKARAAKSYGSTRANFLSAGYGTSGTNSSVPLTAQILSVNGKTAGAGTFSIEAETPVTVVFTTDIELSTISDADVVQIKQEDNTIHGYKLSEIKGNGTNTIVLNAADERISNVVSVSVLISTNKTLTINFNGQSGGDDQTE